MKTITKLFVGSFVAFTVLVTFNVNSFAKTTKALQGDEAIPFRGTNNSTKYVDNNNGSSGFTEEKLSLRGDDAIPYRSSAKFRDDREFVLRLNTGLATADVVEGDARPFSAETKRATIVNIVNRLTRFFIVDVFERIYDNGFPETEPIYFQQNRSEKLDIVD